MHVVIEIIQHQEDNTGDPRIDIEIEYEVWGPFEDGEQAQAWTLEKADDKSTSYYILQMSTPDTWRR
jgi:hypothetical protein